MNQDKKFQISITRKQFFNLLKTVYLGNWIANANRDNSQDEPFIKDYNDVETFIFSLAPKFGFNKYITYQDGVYYPSRFFEEETDVSKIHEEYDTELAWDALSDQLGKRDFYNKYSTDELQRMGLEEKLNKMFECIDFYDEEFIENGIERLHIIKTTKN